MKALLHVFGYTADVSITNDTEDRRVVWIRGESGAVSLDLTDSQRAALIAALGGHIPAEAQPLAIVRELAGLQDGLANGNSSAESAAAALAERAAELVSTGAQP